MRYRLAKGDIEHHHYHKTYYGAHGGQIGIAAALRLRNQLFNDYDGHHTAGKAKHCVEHSPAYISNLKYRGCSKSGHCSGETCRQKSLDNRVEVLEESYHI